MRLHGGLRAEGFARDQTRPEAVAFVRWQICRAVMRERRERFLRLFRQRDPRLNAVQAAALARARDRIFPNA